MKRLLILLVVGTTLCLAAPAQAASSGVLRVACNFSHQASDDPIVFPGQPGASHLHEFFGNTTTNANSTLTSMHNGSTTCRLAGDTAGYWFPAPIGPNGQPYQLRQAVAYYSNQPGGGYVHTVPAGAEMIGGNSAATQPQGVKRVKWDCLADPSVKISATPISCPRGEELQTTVRFPNCWDQHGVDRSSFVYGSKGNSCPSGYVAIPHIRVSFEWNRSSATGFHLSSGSLNSAHADFFNAWNQATLDSELRKAGVIR
jgi:hypothetical protein